MTNGNFSHLITRMLRMRIGYRKPVEKYCRSLLKRNALP